MDAMKDNTISYLNIYNSDSLPHQSESSTDDAANLSETAKDSADDNNKKLISKKGRKLKTNKSQWRKEKGNKYLNKPYKNYKGIEIKSKEFNDYDCKCQMKCKDTLSASERKQEFQKFWELGSYEAQAIFLIARVDEQITKKNSKKKKDKNGESDDSEPVDNPTDKKNKRQFSRTYILKSKQVCRNMFVKTLGITSKRINTALVKMRSKNLIDHRGLSQGGKNKISDTRFDEVVDHIKKMPRYKCSHLQGKMDTEFLPPELSLSKMYSLYTKESDQPVSLSMYKKIYYGKFNFKMKGGKKEICNICKGERKLKNESTKKFPITREKQPVFYPNSSSATLLQEQFRSAPNFMPPSLNCNQTWMSAPPNFPMPQHNATHYFDQQMVYE